MSKEKLSKRDKLYGVLLGLIILCLVALFLQNAGFFGDPPTKTIEIIEIDTTYTIDTTITIDTTYTR